MIDPRITQRQIELEKRKKQQEENLNNAKLLSALTYEKPVLPSYTGLNNTTKKADKAQNNVSISGYSQPKDNSYKRFDDYKYYESVPIDYDTYKKNSNKSFDSKYTQQTNYYKNDNKNIKEKSPDFDKSFTPIWEKYDNQPKENELYKVNLNSKNVKSVEEKPDIKWEKVENQSVNFAKKNMTMFNFMDDFEKSNSKSTADNSKNENEIDLVAGAQAKRPFQNPVINYDEMIKSPDKNYIKHDYYWMDKASKNNQIKSFINSNYGLKPAETDEIIRNLRSYGANYRELNKLKSDEKSAGNTRNKVFTEYIGGYDEYGLNLDGGIPNAFMHIYWAANMTDILGEKRARNFLTAHETYTDEEYENGFLYKQDDIENDINGKYKKYEKNKKYPLVKQHVEMDLHNNDIGIKIALETPENEKEVTKQLSEMLYPGETLESVRERFPKYTDREILYIKKAIRAVYDREASIIWDAPGNNLTGEE